MLRGLPYDLRVRSKKKPGPVVQKSKDFDAPVRGVGLPRHAHRLGQKELQVAPSREADAAARRLDGSARGSPRELRGLDRVDHRHPAERLVAHVLQLEHEVELNRRGLQNVRGPRAVHHRIGRGQERQLRRPPLRQLQLEGDGGARGLGLGRLEAGIVIGFGLAGSESEQAARAEQQQCQQHRSPRTP